MRVNRDEWLTSREGAELLGIRQQNFFYYVQKGKIAVHPEGMKRERLYKRSDIIEVAREIARKTKKPKEDNFIIDWMYPEDVPAGLKLSMQVYSEEIDLREAAVYQAWRKHNNNLTMAAFSEDRKECYATIQLVPLIDEQIIIDVLSGRREEASIDPDEIPGYDKPGGYNLLVASVTCLKDRPMLVYQLLYRYMQFWVDQYPDKYIKHVWAQAVSESGVKLIQHFFMTPRPDVGHNVYFLDLAMPSASRVVRQFKHKLLEKAPFPEELQWRPLVTK